MGDTVRSSDGVALGRMTEGEGPTLLLVRAGKPWSRRNGDDGARHGHDLVDTAPEAVLATLDAFLT